MSGLPFFAQHSINRLRGDVVVRSALHQGVTPAAGEWVDLHLGLAQQLRQAVAVIEQGPEQGTGRLRGRHAAP
jgi:hypothetical protein